MSQVNNRNASAGKRARTDGRALNYACWDVEACDEECVLFSRLIFGKGENPKSAMDESCWEVSGRSRSKGKNMQSDTLVRQAAMVVKCMLLMYYKNSRGKNYRKQVQSFLAALKALSRKEVNYGSHATTEHVKCSF
ncbi:uncharacterized protein A4U43_C04F25220 [Asparagus officinalis]|uniref:Uncharacterized protein n=1 Tax=Asparagus officinalis TaxID=4686 RepID=A0A5P1F3L0_ASPOF|nr:uncharacterized protein A4U43_C04F25220 [Asparagus officinalis]